MITKYRSKKAGFIPTKVPKVPYDLTFARLDFSRMLISEFPDTV